MSASDYVESAQETSASVLGLGLASDTPYIKDVEGLMHTISKVKVIGV